MEQLTKMQEMLKARPGIDIRKRRPGDKIYIEADSGVYVVTVIRPEQALIQLEGSDPRFRTPVIGILLHSVYSLYVNVKLDYWIGQSMRMVISFRNAPYVSGVVSSASIEGSGWKYDVFGLNTPAISESSASR